MYPTATPSSSSTSKAFGHRSRFMSNMVQEVYTLSEVDAQRRLALRRPHKHVPRAGNRSTSILEQTKSSSSEFLRSNWLGDMKAQREESPMRLPRVGRTIYSVDTKKTEETIDDDQYDSLEHRAMSAWVQSVIRRMDPADRLDNDKMCQALTEALERVKAEAKETGLEEAMMDEFVSGSATPSSCSTYSSMSDWDSDSLESSTWTSSASEAHLDTMDCDVDDPQGGALLQEISSSNPTEDFDYMKMFDDFIDSSAFLEEARVGH